MTKRAAKAATPKTRARKTPAKAKTPANPPAAQPDTPKDWPEIDEKTADALFDAIESGKTVKQAAESLGLKGNTVYQWKHRFPKFGARLIEAEDIGIDMMADEEIELADNAFDRDSAAAASVKLEARARYRKLKRPERFNVNPFKPTDPNGGDKGMVFGVVILPALPGAAANAAPVIEGQATRLPTTDPGIPTSAFRLTADGH